MIRCEILTFFDQTFSTIAQLKKETTPVAPAFFSVSSLHGNLSNPFVAFNGRYRLMNPDFSHA